MSIPIQISPSILAADFAALGADCRRMEQAGADMLHVDVMDGHFVPNITIGPGVVAALRRQVSVPLDVHLMIDDPLFFAESFAKAGADIITFHPETGCDVAKTLAAIHALGCKAGLVLKPKTPADTVVPYLSGLDVVMVMTVEPGFGGQAFMHDMLPKIAQLRALAPDLPIEVDGGISAQTGPLAAKAGATVFVAGSALFSQSDYRAGVNELRKSCGG